MNCPTCQSSNRLERSTKTSLGYKQYQCRICIKYFNERTGAAFNYVQYPTDVVMLVILFYTQYKLSLVDVSEIMMLRGLSISHETVRAWTQVFGTEISLRIRGNRSKTAGDKWHMDVTYSFLENRWCYLYRAIDKASRLIDVYLSDKRDTKAAKRFFKQCQRTTGVVPRQITTSKEPALAAAIADILNSETVHRDIKYLNNVMEQNHRGIKSRLQPMKGFKNTWTAMIFSHIFEEFQDFFRSKSRSLARHRRIIVSKFQSYMRLAVQAA